jgi:hypothetical protein
MAPFSAVAKLVVCYDFCMRIILLSVLVLVPSFVRLGWAMSSPPYDAVLKVTYGETTASQIAKYGCLSPKDVVEVTVSYRRLPSRRPASGVVVTTAFSFQGQNAKGEGILLPVYFHRKTDDRGRVETKLTVEQILKRLQRTMSRDPFYAGARRVKGPVQVTGGPEDFFDNSVRFEPDGGEVFRLCVE